MGDVERLLAQEHGVVKVAWLEAHGYDEPRRRRLIRSGELVPVRHGSLAAVGAPAEVVRAVAAGGALSCVSALELQGVWRPRPDGLHVRFDRARRAPGVRGHVLPRRLGIPVSRSADTSLRAIAAAVGCLEEADAVAVVDSVLRRRIVEIDDLDRMAAALGPAAQRILAAADPKADSGAETHARLLLDRLRLRYRSQVPIQGIGVVDFLIGERLVLEVDGRSHHLGDTFFSDRLRDGELVALGFIVLRTTYFEVLERPEALARRILAVVRSRDHLWTSKTARWRRDGGPDPVQAA